MTDDPETDAHKYSTCHSAQLFRSEICGCFYCCEMFPASRIEEWLDDGDSKDERTALCPLCGIESVIGSASGYSIDTGFLNRMRARWFQHM
jgi:hypothetical protein